MLELGKRYRVVRTDSDVDGYVKLLDSFIGRDMELSEITNLGWCGFTESSGWVFHPDWLEEVIEPATESKPTAAKKIRRFESGAVRSDDTGRPRPDFISPYALMALGEHFGGTSNDFGATNYYLGIKPVDCLGSMFRHYCELAIAIHQNDSEAIRDAVKSFAANGIMALHQVEIERLGLYNKVYDKTELVDANEYLKSL